MSRICRGKGPFTCPSCDWNENCRFAWCKYDEISLNKSEEKGEKDDNNKM